MYGYGYPYQGGYSTAQPYQQRLNYMEQLQQANNNTVMNNLVKVNGREGAQAYLMRPNSTMALFDTNEDVFYIKTSDGGGFSTIKAYKFVAVAF